MNGKFHCLCLLLLCLSTVRPEYLVFSSPGGTKHREAGVFGGSISVKDNGNSGNLYEYGYKCSSDDDGGLVTKSMSYDPVSGYILHHVNVRNANLLKLFRGEVCSPLSECSERSAANNTMELLIDSASVAHHIGAVAYYNEEIFFTMFHQELLSGGRHRGTIQLRKLMLGDCNLEFPISSTTLFDIDSCSTLLADLVSEVYDRSKTIRMTGHLKVLPYTHTKLFFYTQIERITYNNNLVANYSIELWEVCPMYNEKLIHNLNVNTELATLDFVQTGGIDYRYQKLCWAAMDQVVCADWVKGNLTNIHVILDSEKIGEACTGSRTIATGIAIAEVNDHRMSFYYGCMADAPGIGGGGLVMINSQKENHVDIHPIHHQLFPVYAGTMFLTESCEGAGIVGGAVAAKATFIFTLASMLPSLFYINT